MSTLLVTGGAGFIGSHLVRALLGDSPPDRMPVERVRILDNFDPFYDVAIKRRRIVELADSFGDRVELVEGDLRDVETCDEVVSGVGGVIHLAALAGVRPSIEDPVRYMDVNVRGTQQLLSAVVKHAPGVRFVFGSSSSVYGGNEKIPFAESDPVDHPVSPYAASKKAGEVLCHAMHHLHGLPLTCLRFFTVYGPGQRPEMAIHKFTRHIEGGQSVPMFGDGSTSRDYTYVDDIVCGVIAAFERARGYRIYNLGGAQTTTLRGLIDTISAATGREAIIEQLPEQPGDVVRTHADASLAERELGCRAKVDIAEGISRFVAWYRRERAAGNVQ